MAGYDFATTYPDVTVPRGLVESYLDQPAKEFLKDASIDAMVKRAYEIVFFQTTIGTTNITMVKQVIEAIAVWHSFGAYMNSMSDNLQDTNKFEFMNKLRHYKDIAIGLGNLLGIDATGKQIEIDTTPVIAAGSGLSVLKDTDHFDGAAGNENV